MCSNDKGQIGPVEKVISAISDTPFSPRWDQRECKPRTPSGELTDWLR